MLVGCIYCCTVVVLVHYILATSELNKQAEVDTLGCTAVVVSCSLGTDSLVACIL